MSVRKWFANRIWLVFWVACLGQAGLWVWWYNYASKHTPERIEPTHLRPRAEVVEERGELGEAAVGQDAREARGGGTPDSEDDAEAGDADDVEGRGEEP